MRMKLVSFSALTAMLSGFYGTIENHLYALPLNSVQALIPEEEPIELFLVGSPASVERKCVFRAKASRPCQCPVEVIGHSSWVLAQRPGMGVKLNA